MSDHVGPVLKVKDFEFTLELPTSFAIRHEIVGVGHLNAQRAFAAALGACVPRLNKMLGISYERSGFQPLAYGGQVIDGLTAHGVTMAHIVDIGGQAYGMLVETFIDEKEVKKAEVFTSPTTEASTS